MSLLSPSRIKAKVIKTFSWSHIKAKIEPQLHLRVPFEAGIYANSPKWSNKGMSSLLLSCNLRDVLLTLTQIWILFRSQ
jgi:hypothetical protein